MGTSSHPLGVGTPPPPSGCRRRTRADDNRWAERTRCILLDRTGGQKHSWTGFITAQDKKKIILSLSLCKHADDVKVCFRPATPKERDRTGKREEG